MVAQVEKTPAELSLSLVSSLRDLLTNSTEPLLLRKFYSSFGSLIRASALHASNRGGGPKLHALYSSVSSEIVTYIATIDADLTIDPVKRDESKELASRLRILFLLISSGVVTDNSLGIANDSLNAIERIIPNSKKVFEASYSQVMNPEVMSYTGLVTPKNDLVSANMEHAVRGECSRVVKLCLLNISAEIMRKHSLTDLGPSDIAKLSEDEKFLIDEHVQELVESMAWEVDVFTNISSRNKSTILVSEVEKISTKIGEILTTVKNEPLAQHLLLLRNMLFVVQHRDRVLSLNENAKPHTLVAPDHIFLNPDSPLAVFSLMEKFGDNISSVEEFAWNFDNGTVGAVEEANLSGTVRKCNEVLFYLDAQRVTLDNMKADLAANPAILAEIADLEAYYAQVKSWLELAQVKAQEELDARIAAAAVIPAPAAETLSEAIEKLDKSVAFLVNDALTNGFDQFLANIIWKSYSGKTLSNDDIKKAFSFLSDRVLKVREAEKSGNPDENDLSGFFFTWYFLYENNVLDFGTDEGNSEAAKIRLDFLTINYEKLWQKMSAANLDNYDKIRETKIYKNIISKISDLAYALMSDPGSKEFFATGTSAQYTNELLAVCHTLLSEQDPEYAAYMSYVDSTGVEGLFKLVQFCAKVDSALKDSRQRAAAPQHGAFTSAVKHKGGMPIEPLATQNEAMYQLSKGDLSKYAIMIVGPMPLNEELSLNRIFLPEGMYYVARRELSAPELTALRALPNPTPGEKLAIANKYESVLSKVSGDKLVYAAGPNAGVELTFTYLDSKLMRVATSRGSRLALNKLDLKPELDPDTGLMISQYDSVQGAIHDAQHKATILHDTVTNFYLQVENWRKVPFQSAEYYYDSKENEIKSRVITSPYRPWEIDSIFDIAPRWDQLIAAPLVDGKRASSNNASEYNDSMDAFKKLQEMAAEIPTKKLGFSEHATAAEITEKIKTNIIQPLASLSAKFGSYDWGNSVGSLKSSDPEQRRLYVEARLRQINAVRAIIEWVMIGVMALIPNNYWGNAGTPENDRYLTVLTSLRAEVGNIVKTNTSLNPFFVNPEWFKGALNCQEFVKIKRRPIMGKSMAQQVENANRTVHHELETSVKVREVFNEQGIVIGLHVLRASIRKHFDPHLRNTIPLYPLTKSVNEEKKS